MGSRTMSVDELREQFYSGSDGAREAFEQLAAQLAVMEEMQVENQEKLAVMEEMQAENQEKVRAKVAALKEMNQHQREKAHKLREKYQALLTLYNDLVEEAKEGSDSSSSSDEDDEEECSIM